MFKVPKYFLMITFITDKFTGNFRTEEWKKNILNDKVYLPIEMIKEILGNILFKRIERISLLSNRTSGK